MAINLTSRSYSFEVVNPHTKEVYDLVVNLPQGVKRNGALGRQVEGRVQELANRIFTHGKTSSQNGTFEGMDDISCNLLTSDIFFDLDGEVNATSKKVHAHVENGELFDRLADLKRIIAPTSTSSSSSSSSSSHQAATRATRRPKLMNLFGRRQTKEANQQRRRFGLTWNNVFGRSQPKNPPHQNPRVDELISKARNNSANSSDDELDTGSPPVSFSNLNALSRSETSRSDASEYTSTADEFNPEFAVDLDTTEAVQNQISISQLNPNSQLEDSNNNGINQESDLGSEASYTPELDDSGDEGDDDDVAPNSRSTSNLSLSSTTSLRLPSHDSGSDQQNNEEVDQASSSTNSSSSEEVSARDNEPLLGSPSLPRTSNPAKGVFGKILNRVFGHTHARRPLQSHNQASSDSGSKDEENTVSFSNFSSLPRPLSSNLRNVNSSSSDVEPMFLEIDSENEEENEEFTISLTKRKVSFPSQSPSALLRPPSIDTNFLQSYSDELDGLQSPSSSSSLSTTDTDDDEVSSSPQELTPPVPKRSQGTRSQGTLNRAFASVSRAFDSVSRFFSSKKAGTKKSNSVTPLLQTQDSVNSEQNPYPKNSEDEGHVMDQMGGATGQLFENVFSLPSDDEDNDSDQTLGGSWVLTSKPDLEAQEQESELTLQKPVLNRYKGFTANDPAPGCWSDDDE